MCTIPMTLGLQPIGERKAQVLVTPIYWIFSATDGQALDRRFSRISDVRNAGVFTLDEITELVDSSFNSNWTAFFEGWHLVPAVRVTSEAIMRAFHPVAAYAVDRHNELVEDAKRAAEREKATSGNKKVKVR